MSIPRTQSVSFNLTEWLYSHYKLILALIMVLGIIGIWSSLLGNTMVDKQTSSDPWTIASHLYQGKGYSACSTSYFPLCKGNEPTAMREPVPVLLFLGAMLLHPAPVAGVWLEVILYIGTVFLLYLSWGKESRLLALIIAALWGLSVPVMQEIGDGNGDLDAAFLFVIGMLFFQKARESRRLLDGSLAGLFLALAVLSRSVLLVAVVALVIGLLFERALGTLGTRLRLAIVFAATVALVLAPWVIRNQITFGAPIVGTTLTGYNLYRENYFLGEPGVPPHYVGAKEADPVIEQLVHNASLNGNENEQQMQALYTRAGVAIISKHPLAYIRLVLFRFFALWFNTGVKAAYGERADLFDVVMVTEQLFLLLAGLIGVWISWKKLWPYAVAVITVCGAYMLVNAQVRYLVDIMPAIAILAGSAVFRLWLDRTPARAEAHD